MAQAENTAEPQSLITQHNAQELLEALAGGKKEAIPQELSWISFVKILWQNNAHLKETIAADREVISFLRGELRRSQQLLSDVLQSDAPGIGRNSHIKIYSDNLADRQTEAGTEESNQDMGSDSMTDEEIDESDKAVDTKERGQESAEEIKIAQGQIDKGTGEVCGDKEREKRKFSTVEAAVEHAQNRTKQRALMQDIATATREFLSACVGTAASLGPAEHDSTSDLTPLGAFESMEQNQRAAHDAGVNTLGVGSGLEPSTQVLRGFLCASGPLDALEGRAEQKQVALHDAGKNAVDIRASSSEIAYVTANGPYVPVSETAQELAAAKEVFQEAAAKTLRKADKVVEQLIDVCQSMGQAQAAHVLEKALHWLRQEEPRTKPAAKAYDKVLDAYLLDGIPEDLQGQIKAPKGPLSA